MTQQDPGEVEATIALAGPSSLMFHPYRAAKTFKDFMEHETDGRWSVEIKRGLGTWNEMLEQVQQGSIEMNAGASEGQHGAFYPNVKVWNTPFAFPNINIANYALDHAYGRDLNADFSEQTGMRMLGWYENGGFRVFVFNREVTSLEEFEGLQIRVQGGGVMESVVEELGAEPVAIDHTELYEALDQGTVDGMDMSPTLIIPNKYHEVQSHIFWTRHVYSRSQIVCNDEWFQNLHPDDRVLAGMAGYLAGYDTRRMQEELRPRTRTALEENGLTINDAPQQVRNDMRSRVQEPALQVVREQVSDESWVDGLLEATDQAKADLGFE